MAAKKRKDIKEIVEIPEGYQTKLDSEILTISKSGKELKRKMNYPIRIEGNKIVLESLKSTKREKRLIKSLVAHINNMIGGLNKNYVYKLQICSVHFPMTATLKGNEIIIKNFLGEVKERKVNVMSGVSVKVDKEIITLESSDKEAAGQTAMNIEKATKIRKRDRRVFQDGIWLIERPERRQ